jgi:hypothetical protein
MRIFNAILLTFLLSACGETSTATGAASNADTIMCAVSGATDFEAACQLEQSQTETGLLLTVRHPGGGFRRLQVVQDGRGVTAADGADTATILLRGTKEIEVSIAGDRYLLPANTKMPELKL